MLFSLHFSFIIRNELTKSSTTNKIKLKGKGNRKIMLYYNNDNNDNNITLHRFIRFPYKA